MKRILTYVIATFIFNTAIAGMLSVVFPEPSFWQQFANSQCVGLSVMTTGLAVFAFVPSGGLRTSTFFIALPFSVALGYLVSFVVQGGEILNVEWFRMKELLLENMTIGLFFGLVGAVASLMFERVDAEVKERQLLKGESEKREIEARLKALQAQIEPHFLFNALANVSSLIDGDPLLAKRLLEHLNDWLRVALARARSESGTLGDELHMLDNYLNILKIRFGDRLRWRIDVPEEARSMAFPPMLLQPLVENAVRHGIEPKIGGGEIDIRAHISPSTLKIEVSDTGVGLMANDSGGAGLANVRARLATLFGGTGRLGLENNSGGGAIATMEVPR